MFLARLFLVISLHSTTEALQCNRYRERTIMNVAMNNKCYYALPRKRGTYNEAVKQCRKGGTHVLFTETKEEHHRLISRLGPAFTRIWIGLERNGSEWRWQGGQGSRPVETLLFADNHASTKGHNAIVNKSKGKYIWQVQDPNNLFQIVCEQEQGQITADRFPKDSISDDRNETTGALGNSDSADNTISKETEDSRTATDMSSQYVVGQGNLYVPGSLTKPVVATGESSGLEGIKSTITASETQMSSEIFDHQFERKKYLSRLPVPSGVNVETSGIFNEEFTVVTDATTGRAWSTESRLEQLDVHGQSNHLGISSNLGAEPVSSITPGQFSITGRRFMKSEQTMEQTLTSEQSGNLGDSRFKGQVVQPGQTIKPGRTFNSKQSNNIGDSSFPGQDINSGQTIKPEQTFRPKHPSRRGYSSLKETHIISEQTNNQARPNYVSDFTFETQSSNPPQASVRQQNNSVIQNALGEAAQESTPMPDQVFSSVIVAVATSTTAVPTAASTTLRTAQYPGTQPLPSVDVLISSPIRSQIHSGRQTMGDKTSSVAVTESNQLSSPIHSPINAGKDNIDLSARSTFFTAFVGPPLITEIINRPTSAIPSIGSFKSSPRSNLMESSVPEQTSDMESGSLLRLSLELSSVIGSSVSGSSAKWKIWATVSGDTGSSASGAIASSVSGGLISSSVPAVISPFASGAISSLSLTVFGTSTSDRILTSTSAVSVSAQTGSYASAMVESSALGGSESSVLNLIRPTASSVIELISSGQIKPSASSVNKLSSSVFNRSPTSGEIAPTASGNVGPSVSSAIVSSSPADISGSLSHVEVWPPGAGSVSSFAPSVFTSSTLDRLWSSTVTSDVIVVSDLTEVFASSTTESSVFGGMDSSAPSRIRSTASGVIWSPSSGVTAPTASGDVGLSASGTTASPTSGGVSGSIASVVIWPAGASIFGSGVSRSSSLDIKSDVIESTAFGMVELTASVVIDLSASGVAGSAASHLGELSTTHVTESSAVIGPTAFEGVGTPSSGGVTGSIVSFAPSVVTSSTLNMIGSSTSDMIATTVSDLTVPFVAAIIELSAYDVHESSASDPIKASASGFTRLSSSGLYESHFLGLSSGSASDMPELPVSVAFVTDVFGSYASGEVRSSTLRKTGSADADGFWSHDLGPVSSRLLSSATLEESAYVLRTGTIFSSLNHASAVLSRDKSGSIRPSMVFIPFNSSDSSSKPASMSLDTPTSSSGEPQAVSTTDLVQGTISTPSSIRDSITTTGSFDVWTDFFTSPEPILDSIPTISVTMLTTTSIAVSISSAVSVGLTALQNGISTSSLSSPGDMGHAQNNVPEILEAGHYIVANSSNHSNNIETFAFRKVTTITDVTMTTSFPATTTISCARLCASGQYECNFAVFRDGICRLYSL